MRCALGNVRLHVMAGSIRPNEDRARGRAVYLNNLECVTQQAASAGIIVVIEPINTRDIPGYLLNRQDGAHSVCADVGALNLKVEMDFYHCQIVEEDLAVKLRKYIGGIGHTQIAGRAMSLTMARSSTLSFRSNQHDPIRWRETQDKLSSSRSARFSVSLHISWIRR
jgi:sugar phosphate isomerase/epimerase